VFPGVCASLSFTVDYSIYLTGHWFVLLPDSTHWFDSEISALKWDSQRVWAFDKGCSTDPFSGISRGPCLHYYLICVSYSTYEIRFMSSEVRSIKWKVLNIFKTCDRHVTDNSVRFERNEVTTGDQFRTVLLESESFVFPRLSLCTSKVLLFRWRVSLGKTLESESIRWSIFSYFWTPKPITDV
jgi:hypothetical protein